jgi:hypothetical protein
MSNVIDWPHETRLDISSEKVLTKAIEQQITDVIVIGRKPDGSEYFASAIADGGDVLWLLERMKRELLEIGS